jgi:hypothetical protein
MTFWGVRVIIWVNLYLQFEFWALHKVTNTVVILAKKTTICWAKNCYFRFFAFSKCVLLHIILPQCVYIPGVNIRICYVWISAAWIVRSCAVLIGTAGVLTPAAD